MNSVATMPAEEQLKAVAKKLRELNPGLEGKLTGIEGNSKFEGQGTPRIENGVVTEVWFYSDGVTDISPIRALVGLKVLNCRGTGDVNKNKFSDLSPLQGLKLTKLICDHTKITDLSPLAQMPLTILDCASTPLASLSPLKGMPLTMLWCNGTLVSDLSPLEGMPLTFLHIGETKVIDLSPLQKMPLKNLHISPSLVSDLSPLRGLPLSVLICDKALVTDLSPLEGMQLGEIAFNPKRITKGDHRLFRN